MLSKVYSATTVGLDGVLIDVEVDVAGRGFPTFTIVGLPNKSIDEAKERVRTAITNAGYEMPDSRITVNLAPADIPKTGSSFDLPIALGILASANIIQKDQLAESIFLGELSLEGKLRQVPGVISVAILAKEKIFQRLFIPTDNVSEASLITSVTLYPVESLTQLIFHLNKQKEITPYIKSLNQDEEEELYEYDFADIKGQEQAKRALEIAASGFHNVHLKGVPGAGKTMLSRAFPSILSPLSEEEILEVSRIYSISGLLNGKARMASRPFRAPHHTTSRIGLIGGGTNPSPGEISLAHRGVLFLDEFPEFPRSVLESLRQPLEDGQVTVSRAAGSLTFPSRFLLLAASNPCPCGYLGHPVKRCKCFPGAIASYNKRISGPLLDRIDIHIDVPPVDEVKLTSEHTAEASAKIRSRVQAAIKRQKQRYTKSDIKSNSELTPLEIKKYCRFSDDATALLKQAVSRLSLSARSYFKIVKISQTIADLAGEELIARDFVAEALQYRMKED